MVGGAVAFTSLILLAPGITLDQDYDRVAERQGDIVLLPMEPPYYNITEVTYYAANASLALGPDFFLFLPLDERIDLLRQLHIRRLLKVLGATWHLQAQA